MRYGRSVQVCRSGCVVERVKNQNVRRKRVTFSLPEAQAFPESTADSAARRAAGWPRRMTKPQASESHMHSCLCLPSLFGQAPADHSRIIGDSTSSCCQTVHTSTRQVTACPQRPLVPRHRVIAQHCRGRCRCEPFSQPSRYASVMQASV